MEDEERSFIFFPPVVGRELQNCLEERLLKGQRFLGSRLYTQAFTKEAAKFAFRGRQCY